MFRKRTTSPTRTEETGLANLPSAKPKTSAELLEEAASKLAASLSAYSEAAYHASKSEPDAELRAASDKLKCARKLVLEGRLAFALGQCLPKHVEHWPTWSQRDDFGDWVGFKADDISATETKEKKGSQTFRVATIQFTFDGRRYRLVLRDYGMSPVPDMIEKHGDVELFLDQERVAKFEIFKDLMKEYSDWEFRDVSVLKAGPWMKDVIDMASQIETSRRERIAGYLNQRTREASREIDLNWADPLPDT